MTDNTQPEALRLANVCSNLTRHSMDAHLIAGELRRQHARIAELEAQPEAIGAGGVSAPPTAQAEGWRPIETAPRDGSEVLAYTAGLGRVVVYFDDEESQWGTGLGYLHYDEPTHWMPLPPPPTSAEGVEHG